MSRSVDASAEKVVMAEISGDGSKLTNVTLAQIANYGAITTRKLTLRNVVTDGTAFGISNTNPVDTLAVGTTAFINNISKKLTVKGRIKADTYDVSEVSSSQDVLVNEEGSMVGANNVTHNRSTGAFVVGGRFSAGKITVTRHAQDNQLLFSNTGTLEGAPITYNTTTQETTIPGKLNILGGLKVLGGVSQVKVENVVIDDPILEISSNSEDNTTSGIIIQRPSGNVAISYQDDDTFNLSYTNGSAYGTSLSIDTTRILPVKIQGTLRVLKGISVHDHAQDNQVLYSNAGTLEGAAISYNPTTGRTTISGSLEVEGGIVGDISGGVTIDNGNNHELLYNDNGSVAGTTMLFDKTNNQTSFPNQINVIRINFL